MDHEHSRYAYIYVFVSKGPLVVDFKKRLFFIETCVSSDLKDDIKKHIRDVCIVSGTNNEIDKDRYINDTIGLYNFDIFILDTVPIHLKLTYKKLYYDMLCMDKFVLKNRLEITAEYNIRTQSEFVRSCKINMHEFQERILKNMLSEYEILVNELKDQYILVNEQVMNFNEGHSGYCQRLRLKNTELYEKNKKLKKSYDSIKHSNDLLRSFNDFLKNPTQYNSI